MSAAGGLAASSAVRQRTDPLGCDASPGKPVRLACHLPLIAHLITHIQPCTPQGDGMQRWSAVAGIGRCGRRCGRAELAAHVGADRMAEGDDRGQSEIWRAGGGRTCHPAPADPPPAGRRGRRLSMFSRSSRQVRSPLACLRHRPVTLAAPRAPRPRFQEIPRPTAPEFCKRVAGS